MASISPVDLGYLEPLNHSFEALHAGNGGEKNVLRKKLPLPLLWRMFEEYMYICIYTYTLNMY